MQRPALAAFAGLVSSLALAGAPVAPRSELEALQLATGRTKAEISGVGQIRGRLMVVSDGADDHYLYEVKSLHGRRFDLDKDIDLAKLKGFDELMSELKQAAWLEPRDRRLDLEGIAHCEDTIYLANERVRQVLTLNLKDRTIRRAPIDLTGVTALLAGEANAGFEGIAADCDRQVLYLAKERDPRLIVKVDLKTFSVTGTFDVPPSDRGGQKVVHPSTGDGLLTIGPDFADLMFAQGHLYALERNTYEIAKIDPATETVVQRVSYFMTEKGLYETGEPFGLAEALLLTKDEILIGFDNNNKPLSGVGAAKLGAQGAIPLLVRFKRPAGF